VLILPAIDLRGGQCVRLRQGDYARETVFGGDPAAMARRWAEQGAKWLHLVDLDGAREGRPINGDSVRAIVRAAGLPCQLGGGLRSDAHVEEALGWGVTRVVVGTRALRDPVWCQNLCRRFPDRDGMLEGPNVEATAELASAVGAPVIASGGVTTLDDVARLARCGLAGCIIGRALYEGRIDLAAAVALADGGERGRQPPDSASYRRPQEESGG